MAALIRAATPADFLRVRALVFSSHARAMAAPGRDVTSRLPLIFPSLESEAQFSAPSSHFWVAEGADASILGAISIISDADPGIAELNAFYVAEGHQRRGIGARLMEAALGFCRAGGVKRVDLTSNVGVYDAAIAFYKRLGFKHKREYEVGSGIVLVELELELPSHIHGMASQPLS